SEYQDTEQPEPLPGSVEDPVQLTPPQLPNWLHTLPTTPPPRLPTAFDPRIGQRILPDAPLPSQLGPDQMSVQTVRKTADSPPYRGNVTSLPWTALIQTPSSHQFPPPPGMPKWPTLITPHSPQVTAQYPGSAQQTRWDGRLQPPQKGWSY